MDKWGYDQINPGTLTVFLGQEVKGSVFQTSIIGYELWLANFLETKNILTF